MAGTQLSLGAAVSASEQRPYPPAPFLVTNLQDINPLVYSFRPSGANPCLFLSEACQELDRVPGH